jgi:hypothetical protein
MKLAARLFGLLALGVLGLTGCHELGHVDGLGGYGDPDGNLVGEVRYVDSRARQIELRTESGRALNIRYDNQTRVVYRQRDYAVSDLEPGDYVAVRAQQDRDGRYSTDLITVRESVQDRSGGSRTARLDRLEGRVESIDARRGSFEVRDRAGRRVLVSMPYDPPRVERDRFSRLREGDYIRVEGSYSDPDRFQLDRFL